MARRDKVETISGMFDTRCFDRATRARYHGGERGEGQKRERGKRGDE